MKKIIELFKYGIYGAITTVVNLFLFIVLKEAGLHYIFANSFSYIIAVCVNYVLNRKYVFRNKAQSVKGIVKEFAKFLFVRLVALAADNILFCLFVELCGLNIYLVRVFLSFASIMATFFANKIYVFKANR